MSRMDMTLPWLRDAQAAPPAPAPELPRGNPTDPDGYPPLPETAAPAPQAPDAAPEAEAADPAPPEGSTSSRSIWRLAQALKEAPLDTQADLMLDPRSLETGNAGDTGYILSGGKLIMTYELPKEEREPFETTQEAEDALREAVSWLWARVIQHDAIKAARKALKPYARDPQKMGKDFMFILRDPKVRDLGTDGFWTVQVSVPVSPTPMPVMVDMAEGEGEELEVEEK